MVAHNSAGYDPSARDERAFGVFHQQWREAVRAWVISMTGDLEQAEDVTLDVFLRAWRGLPRFRGECTLRTWLFRLTANCCRTALARRGRQDVLLFSELADDQAGGMDPQTEMERHAAGDGLEAALAALQPQYRELILRCDVQGQSYAEAATATGLTLGQVKMRLLRGRRALKQRYTGKVLQDG